MGCVPQLPPLFKVGSYGARVNLLIRRSLLLHPLVGSFHAPRQRHNVTPESPPQHGWVCFVVRRLLEWNENYAGRDCSSEQGALLFLQLDTNNSNNILQEPTSNDPRGVGSDVKWRIRGKILCLKN